MSTNRFTPMTHTEYIALLPGILLLVTCNIICPITMKAIATIRNSSILEARVDDLFIITSLFLQHLQDNLPQHYMLAHLWLLPH